MKSSTFVLLFGGVQFFELENGCLVQLVFWLVRAMIRLFIVFFSFSFFHVE